jgi:ankyrin repeat protein
MNPSLQNVQAWFATHAYVERNAPVLLQNAVLRGDVDMASLLLHANAHVCDAEGLIRGCFVNEDVDALKCLLQAGGGRLFPEGAALVAVQWADLDLLEALLEGGAVLNHHAENAFVHACAHGMLAFVQALVHGGFDADSLGDRGLEEAARAGHTQVVQFVLDAGCPPPPGALIFAAGHGDADMVQLLLRAGADVHTNNDAALVMAHTQGKAITQAALVRAAGPFGPAAWHPRAQNIARAVWRAETWARRGGLVVQRRGRRRRCWGGVKRGRDAADVTEPHPKHHAR